MVQPERTASDERRHARHADDTGQAGGWSLGVSATR
jgi:hypothetical protein